MLIAFGLVIGGTVLGQDCRGYNILLILFDDLCPEMEILEKILNNDEAYEMINRMFQNEFEVKNAA